MVKLISSDPCPDCGALESCCKTAQDRLETANALTRLVERQKGELELLRDLRREIERDRRLEAKGYQKPSGLRVGDVLDTLAKREKEPNS